MTPRQQKMLENRVARLKEEGLALREKLGVFKRENQVLKRALRDGRGLLEKVPGGLVLIQEGRVALINANALGQLGYSEEEALGRDFLDFVHPDVVEQVRGLHRKRISGKSVPNHYETYMRTKAGETIFCEVRIKKVRYQGRRAFLVHIIGLDKQKEKETEKIQKEKTEALVRMASGLRQELKGCMDLLGDISLKVEAGELVSKEDLHGHFNGVERLREKVDSMTRKLGVLAGDGFEDSAPVPFDLKKTIQGAVAATRPVWKKRSEDLGVEIKVKTYLRTISPVSGYPGELQDAISSMILNAVEALPQGGEIYLSTEENAGFAHIFIQDNGPGIPDGIRHKISDPFFTTKKDGISGMGLCLAYATVHRHGGEIGVVGKGGRGTAFGIRLPLMKSRPSGRGKRGGKKLRDSGILIIADEGMVKDLLSHLFKCKGCKISAVPTGMEALKYLNRNRCDLIIADLDSPYLEASKIIPRLKKARKDIKIVLVNAEEETQGTDALRKMGADLVVGRPLDLDRILSLVSKELAGRKNQLPQ